MTTALLEICFGGKDAFDTHDARVDRHRAAETAAPVLSQTDAQIAAAIQRGEADVFDTLVSERFPGLARFAHGLLGSADAAQDVVQTVFIRIWAARKEWSPVGGVSAYLYRAVRNQALNELAKRKTEARYRTNAAGANEDIVTESGEQTEHDERVRALQAVLAGLAERRRTALRLRFEEGLPYAEIAAVLGISEKAAQELVSRAVGTLRDRLQHLR